MHSLSFFHHEKNRPSRARYLFAAFLYFVRGLALLAAAIGILWAYENPGTPWVIQIIAGGIGGVLLISIISAFVSGGLRCPICSAKVFGSDSCSRNAKAKRLLGSYNLPFAFSVMTVRQKLEC
ncbi:hypothetical protein N9920_00755 [Akkermansiaceae bacterium]|nr:hypothetical protein [Akkermansiaceae bacterium]MDB4277261.1 hypothetical protein [bacterium]MDB4276311.1 hypothetical protein [Akkermansiaceae bacterium]MDB4309541.1 hypothetical protein [Akkermansiaceae bacterium]MDB4312683.1 hypothetical protein [Akkermansiaceae bacterium]